MDKKGKRGFGISDLGYYIVDFRLKNYNLQSKISNLQSSKIPLGLSTVGNRNESFSFGNRLGTTW